MYEALRGGFATDTEVAALTLLVYEALRGGFATDTEVAALIRGLRMLVLKYLTQISGRRPPQAGSLRAYVSFRAFHVSYLLKSALTSRSAGDLRGPPLAYADVCGRMLTYADVC